MDADFSHKPSDVPRLYAACAEGGADLAIGSRYCNGISVINWPIGRVIMSYYASAYVRTVLRMKVYDTTAGLSAIPARFWKPSILTGSECGATVSRSR